MVRSFKLPSQMIIIYYLVICFSTFVINSITAKEVRNFGIKVINLNGFEWTASGFNGSKEISVPAEVPGGIYSALEKNGVLRSSIYHDYNDVEHKWVGRLNWTYSRSFTAPDDLYSKKSKVTLVCEGLDTISKIFVNGLEVGSSQNMFVRYEFDITNAIKNDLNTIEVAFESPVLYAQKEYEAHESKYGYGVLPASLVPEFRGENKAQMIRKMQSSFSWDWGPSYPSSGIWKDIYIEAFNGAVIRDVLIFTTPNTTEPDESDKTTWELKAKVYFDIATLKETGILTLKSNSDPSQSVSIRIALSSAGTNKHSISITIPGSKVALWWPNGYGKQALYNFTLIYTSDSHEEISSRVVRVGFRTTELIEDFVDSRRTELGREFYFKVNGLEFYSKGSNSIPQHVLPELITPAQTRWLLESARDVHTNMIRVWGGGMYESNLFYDLADELGIFIWQDFMFACSMYPATPEFLRNVKEEVSSQVKRLQHHPSVVLWAGNNENEAALRQNWYGTAEKFEVYRLDYLRLYIDTIKPLVEHLDPSRKYLSSSPTNGIQSEIEGWVAHLPQDIKYGDIHQYDYYGDSWDWTIFRQGRYASEYGFQSFPYYGTLADISSNLNEWTWDSEYLDHRQRHPKGQMELRELIKAHLPFPQDYNSVEAFPAMLYLAQITQVMGQKTETELYRRLMDKLNETTGAGHNMGALYWQLNDIGPYCSWASIEYNGRWKMQHYYAKMFFNPILPSPYLNDKGDVVVEFISDSLEQVFKQMRVRVFKTDSMVPLIEVEKSVTATYLSSREVLRIPASQLAEVGCDNRKKNLNAAPCVVYIDLRPGCVTNFLYLQYPVSKKFIVNPNITVDNVKQLWDGRITFEVKVYQIAQFVFLNLIGRPDGNFVSMGCEGPGEFDGNLNNGFLMVDPVKFMVYKSVNPITVDEFLDELEIISLYDAASLNFMHLK